MTTSWYINTSLLANVLGGKVLKSSKISEMAECPILKEIYIYSLI